MDHKQAARQALGKLLLDPPQSRFDYLPPAWQVRARMADDTLWSTPWYWQLATATAVLVGDSSDLNLASAEMAVYGPDAAGNGSSPTDVVQWIKRRVAANGRRRPRPSIEIPADPHTIAGRVDTMLVPTTPAPAPPEWPPMGLIVDGELITIPSIPSPVVAMTAIMMAAGVDVTPAVQRAMTEHANTIVDMLLPDRDETMMEHIAVLATPAQKISPRRRHPGHVTGIPRPLVELVTGGGQAAARIAQRPVVASWSLGLVTVLVAATLDTATITPSHRQFWRSRLKAMGRDSA